jgi:Fic family protein
MKGKITMPSNNSKYSVEMREKTANNRLSKLVKEGLVTQTGRGRSTKYKII